MLEVNLPNINNQRVVLQSMEAIFLQPDAEGLCCMPCRRGWWWQGTARSTRSEITWKDCEGQREAKPSTVLRCLLGSSSAGLLLVGSSWLTPTAGTKMGWEAEISGSIDTFAAGLPSEKANL